MLHLLFVLVIFGIGMHFAYKDNNRDVAAWREGRYFVATLWFLWYVLKVFLFFLFAPFFLFFLLFK